MSPLSERESLAAEYVLGALDTDEAAAVREAAQRDRALAAAISGWEEQLAPLALLAPPVAPLPGLWTGIAADLGLEPATPRSEIRPPETRPRLATVSTETKPSPYLTGGPRPRREWGRRHTGLMGRLWRDPDVWRLAGVLALVAGMGGVAYEIRAFRLETPVAVATLTARDSAQPEARVEISADGSLRLRPDRRLTVAANTSLAVWALPLGAHAPMLLGAIPPDGGRMQAPPLPDGSQVMVTLEPQGGPGATPGPPLFAGVVTTVRQGAAGGG